MNVTKTSGWALTALALLLLAGCASVGVPKAGGPVKVEEGRSLVFGALRAVDAKNEKIGYSPFGFNPYDQPFFGPGPEMSLELRQMQKPGGAVRYRSHPFPPVEEGGSFYWILESGDYRLYGNRRRLTDREFDPAESFPLARFTVPAKSGTLYVGTLVIPIDFDLGRVAKAWAKGEAEYEIGRLRMVSDTEAATAALRRRFTSYPEPLSIAPMTAE